LLELLDLHCLELDPGLSLDSGLRLSKLAQSRHCAGFLPFHLMFRPSLDTIGFNWLARALARPGHLCIQWRGDCDQLQPPTCCQRNQSAYTLMRVPFLMRLATGRQESCSEDRWPLSYCPNQDWQC